MKKFFSICGLVLALLFSADSSAALSGVQQVDANYIPVQGATGNRFYDASAVTATATNLALTSNVVTITATHSYAVGQTVTVALLTGPTLFADCNGTFVITAVSTTVSFSYALTHADITTGAATGTITGKYESPIAAGTTLVKIVWPTNATRLFLSTSAVCSIQPTATTIAAGTNGSYPTIANVVYELFGKPGDTTYIMRTNSSVISFRFAILQ